MSRFGLLVLPATNRVYAHSAVDLTRAELEIFSGAVLGGRIGELDTATVGGARYVTFTADGGLDERDAALLGNVSAAYALFEFVGDLLRPVPLTRLDRYDDDLVTIQKYVGKTNEQFTKLLLNVTLLATEWAGDLLTRRFRVLDPLCGRGTTLNQAVMYGFDAAGVDRDQKDFEAYQAFLTTWLKRKRVKHRVLESGPVRRERKVVGKRLRVELAASKEAHKAGDVQTVDVVSADTTRVGEFFRPESVDLVVADAPYGVQHGSRTAETGLARDPLALLTAAVPKWVRLLRPGGALGISWNTNVARRDDAAAVLTDAGLDVCDDGPWRGLAHRVDQAIVRDVLVARRPG
ncbi:Methyltransferase domain-containing protein [Micromonospora nigra]|uniref:Methyltransferase domain-containing protein n=1 Tax=Micromonospora nigra TaxID=145857 RepID=A0A1C6SZ62_9ACTN|nr:SAM-dependent methyltransferase [Micromonospora nigra]SCL34669.1 Methyltransferase domain-containing protein [Micromonospora nigra]